jgi:hypothetical protein
MRSHRFAHRCVPGVLTGLHDAGAELPRNASYLVPAADHQRQTVAQPGGMAQMARSRHRRGGR